MIKVYGIIAAALALIGLIAYADFEHKRANANAVIAQQWKDAATAAQRERDTARTAMNARDTAAETKYKQDVKGLTDDYEKRIARIKSSAHSGLFVNATGAASGAQQGQTAANSTGTSASARTELPATVGLDLRALARDCNTEVIQRNDLLTRLLSCRTALEAP